ncbi:MAG TPA: HD domain-containing protein [Candidatus Babeliales bacterium]|jgi:tRNA nucleotidyltransferase (CCA-adding enzyme)|nr:HD domain-containing protein [Candidatus Babeliales bacterium]
MKFLSSQQYEKVYAIVHAIAQHKGRALLVGGAVRDMVMGRPVKDIDIEVYHLSEKQLEDILRQFGPVSLVGKAFGVLRIHGLDVDWSLPRADSPGRKPTVVIDPHMSVETAARRRDLTMNAMALDLMTDELIDPCHGLSDIKNKILRTPDARFFIQDPLRFYRVMQFIGRFEMQPDNELNTLCMQMDISHVSRERIEEEFKKLFLLSQRPSLGIRWLYTIGRLQDVLPELAATVGVEQNPQYHPEGDVFEHSMQAVDAAATIAHTYDNDFDKLVLLYAALCHDLGKVTTTREVDGVIKSIGHEKESKKLTRIMLKRITHNIDIMNAVSSLVLYHMTPLQFIANNAKLPAYKRLANKLAHNVNVLMLIDLCIADKRGRNGDGCEPLTCDFPDVELFREKVLQAGVATSTIEPILKGADLFDFVQPGPYMGRLLLLAYEKQIDEDITDKSILKEYVRKIMKKKL